MCATCHAEQTRAFESSVHGRGVRMGLGDAPLCTSCHTAHAVIKTKTAAFRNNIPEVCGNCHADPQIMRRYGLLPVYQTYQAEFHGVTTRLYRLVTPLAPSPAAVCYDCHTAHSVLRVADPASAVSPANLLATCRRCHTAAGRFFATGWTEHKIPSLRDATLVFMVQVFYWVLIPGTVGVLALLTALVCAFLGARTAWTVSAAPVPPKTVEAIAELMLTRYVIPFEVAALLLLVALIGAIILAKEVEPND
ncbi:MAG: NADH-quinone oxidoreductase subunit J [Peptococcaceae bacterium]|nr:NADH-quinone oxidoreductase subunit J [Peptococcaceae bacterium]